MTRAEQQRQLAQLIETKWKPDWVHNEGLRGENLRKKLAVAAEHFWGAMLGPAP